MTLQTSLLQLKSQLQAVVEEDSEFPLPFSNTKTHADTILQWESLHRTSFPESLKELYTCISGIEFGPDLIPPPIVFIKQLNEVEVLSGVELFGTFQSLTFNLG